VPTPGDHRHCKVCGRTCDPEKTTCSKACAQQLEERLRTKRMYTYILYASIALLAIVFVSRLI
jgi:predicted nucleic acid-binding Zn ribbon protein